MSDNSKKLSPSNRHNHFFTCFLAYAQTRTYVYHHVHYNQRFCLVELKESENDWNVISGQIRTDLDIDSNDKIALLYERGMEGIKGRIQSGAGLNNLCGFLKSQNALGEELKFTLEVSAAPVPPEPRLLVNLPMFTPG